MIKVTQADRDFADAIAEEGPRLLRGIFRQELAEGVAMYRISALTTAQAQAAAQEQRIKELEGALRKIAEWPEGMNDMNAPLGLARRQANIARAALGEQQ